MKKRPKKHVRQILSLFLALALVMTLNLSALADNDSSNVSSTSETV